MTTQERYRTRRESLAEMFMASALMGNCQNPTARAAFDAAEDFLAELKVQNDADGEAAKRP
jgi:hypothetical protein